ISGSDFRTVWARHGNAAAEKISPNAKVRMFIVPPAGGTIISDRDQKLHAAQNLFSHLPKTAEPPSRRHYLNTAGVKPASPKLNGRREAGLWTPNKKAGLKPAFVVSIRSAVSISGGSRSTPTKPVVHADLGGVLVVAETATGDIGRPRREGGVAEIVILVLGLGRPVRGEHVFETAADRIAVLVAAIGGEGRRHAGHRHPEIVAIPPGVTALGVEQRRTPGVAEPAGHRPELVGVRGHEGAARKQHAII